MGSGIYRMGAGVNQQPFYTPEGVVIIGLNEEFILKRDAAGYYLKRRGEQGYGHKFDPDYYLDACEFLMKGDVEEGHEERHLAGSVWLRKRPQYIVMPDGTEKNVGIYSLIDKGDFLPDEVSITIKAVLYALQRIARVPEEFLSKAKFRSSISMAGGTMIRAGQKMK